jgi:putative membrane-bound dehydrogenase-like protein
MNKLSPSSTARRAALPAALLILVAAAQRPACGQGYPPEEAAQRMTVAADLADDLAVSLFASEPDVRQPIFVKCDDRGRLWTIQYLQYPNPAGLQRVQVDRWSRTVYDRVPEPPPHGPRGADRITICEDTDGDGKADRFHDFVDGLNLATGVALGHGGVFVLNVPYLLFYPDRDRDDVPDSDPEVLLKGFGMEDGQSMSNHLTWGPDGWLYGVNGSTTTCNIRGIEFQSGVWRYHPGTHAFELFCEGGYNCYGLTFDENGELFYSTNGGPFIHAMQGAYYYKSFGKHGPLHNRYAYHHFPMLECDSVPGGPPTGGTVYLGPSFPSKLRGKFVAGNFLGHTASWWQIHPAGSTFRATFGATLVDSHDTWCGPTDMCVGPDGAMYLSDFYDQRTAHPDPDAKWDLSNGRIYRIHAPAAAGESVVDARDQSSEQLVACLRQGNRWVADRARLELAHRKDRSVAADLQALATQTQDGILALQGLWALNAIGELDEALARELLNHPYPYVRYWVVRLAGDLGQVGDALAGDLARLAGHEPSAPVVAQLAATARRLPADQGLPILTELLRAEGFGDDARIPWLVWWAIDTQAVSATPELAELFSAPQAWRHPAFRENAFRLIRRWSSQGDREGYQACLKLLRSAPADHSQAAHAALRQGLSERSVGLHGIGQGGLFDQQAAQDDAPPVSLRQYEPLTDELQRYIAQRWQVAPTDLVALELAVRGEVRGAYASLVEAIRASAPTDDALIGLLNLLREVGDQDAAREAVRWAMPETIPPVLLAALDVVDARGDSPAIESLLSRYQDYAPEAKTRLRDLFFSRADVARKFLQRVDRGEIPATEVPIAQLTQVAAHADEEIDRLVQRHWGKIGRGSDEEILATMRRLSNDLRAGTGDLSAGKQLFTKHCSICHQLHGEGNQIGPDLTTANRRDRAALLENVVNPNAVIRREYTSYIVLTVSGRTIAGMLAEENPAAVTLLDAQNRRIKIPRDEIDDIYPSETSLMPERLLDPLSPQELRDLFRYLEE